MKDNRIESKIFIFIILVTLWSTINPVYAQTPPPTLDGFLDTIYRSHGYSINYAGYYPAAKATLYVLDVPGIDPDYVWIAWVVSRDFNDNSYGGKDYKHDSWQKGHNLEDLAESDMQRLDLENSCGDVVLDITMDYIDSGYPTPSGYGTGKDSVEFPVPGSNPNNWIVTGDWSHVEFQTSLHGNLNTLGYCTDGNCTDPGTGHNLLNDSPPWEDEPTYDPASPYDDWEYSQIWELRIDRAVFESGCPGGDIMGIATDPIELHASPSKILVNPVTLYRVTSSIGNYVWFDINRDGVQDVTEAGFANVTLDLYSDPDGNGDHSDGSVVATTTTDSYGHYLFSNIGSGNYVVDVTDVHGVLNGFSLTTGSIDPHTPITLPPNGSYLDADFGYAPTDTTKGVIGDYVWSDADNDGRQDPGEPGIGGVTIDLLADLDGDGNFTDVIASTTTAANGSYLFMNIDPDEYKVDVTDTGTVLAGYTLTTGPQSSTDPTDVIYIGPGDVYLNADFGYYQAGLGTIGNQIWIEADQDGIFEPGESGVSGVSVDLIKDNNGNGIWDAGDVQIATANTAADGTYQFSGLPLDDGDGDADYLIHVSDTGGVLANMLPIFGPNPGTDNNGQVDPYAVSLTAASPSNQTADFGYYVDTIEDTGLVGDRVWFDLNNDGIEDGGESGIANVTVDLYSPQGNGWNFVGTTTTNANGYYFFPHLPLNDEYRVEVVSSNFDPGGPLEGFTATNQPDHMDESDTLTSDNPFDLTLDFGYYISGGGGPTHDIGDYVWFDVNGDGIQDPAETGFEDVNLALYLDSNSNGQIDPGEPVLATDTTDANGNYLFEDLADGNYIVQVTDDFRILDGYVQSAGLQPWPVTLNGADRLDIDFGYYLPRPTLAVLSSFKTYTSSGNFIIEWTTASEVGTVAFYLYRLDKTTGSWLSLNKQMLPGLLHSGQGGTYRYIDNSSSPGAANTYKLVEIETNGKKRMYGPFTVLPDGPGIDFTKYRFYGEVERSKSTIVSNFSDSGFSSEAHGLSATQTILINTRKSLKTASLTQAQARKGTKAKIAVVDSGLYYVSAEEIALVFGIPVSKVKNGIRKNQLNLSNGGKPVAYMPAADYSAIYFYGEKIESNYTFENIYWLKAKPGLIMQPVDTSLPAAQTVMGTFISTLHVEEEKNPAPSLFQDPQEDYWLWDYIVSGNPSLGTRNFVIQTPGAVIGSGNAELTVTLHSSTNTSADPDHHVKLSVNGTEVADESWDGTNQYIFNVSFDQALLIDGDNLIEVTGLLDSGVPYSIFYVDSFDLSYHRRFKAHNNTLEFKSNQTGTLTINGFTDPDIVIIDITNPRRPKVFINTNVTNDGGEYSVNFNASGSGRTYIAASTTSLNSPVSLIADKRSNLDDTGNYVDYLVITPAQFINMAEALTQYRQQQGLATMVVELEDVMDEFNHGIYSPEAIRIFLRYTYKKWDKYPDYVVLAGNGTFDHRDILGIGDNLIPPLMVGLTDGLFASDALMADVKGNDGIPEMAIGRLPVSTRQQFKIILNKIKAYEESYAGAWSKRVMVLADNPDNGGNFSLDSDEIAGYLPFGYTGYRIYLADFTIDAARQKILEETNRGLLLINFLGHSGVDRFAQEGLVITSDMDLLNNEYKLPIVTAMSCIVGRFSIPGYDSLSEAFMLRNNGGAIAVWSPSGTSFNDDNKMLGVEFFKVFFQSGENILGKVIMEAMRNFSVSTHTKNIQYLFNLLGDPALIIH